MSTRYIQNFDDINQILSQGNDSGIGVVGDSAYVVIDGNASVIGRVGFGTHYYLDPQNGDDDDNDGKSPANAFATTAALDLVLTHGDTVHIRGVVKENWAPGNLNDITLIGEANTPRQATDSGVANGAGATWLNPGSVASPLIHLASSALDKPSQSWKFFNIFFNNAGDAPCLKLDRKITGADSSHASVIGCKFTGADSGIQTGEINNLSVLGCTFFDFVGATDCGIEASVAGGIASPPYMGWVIEGNNFFNNVDHIIGSLRNATICNNNFQIIGRTITTTIALSLASGANNSVYLNMFNRPLNTSPNATLYVGGTNDIWSHNYGSDGLFYGVPDNS